LFPVVDLSHQYINGMMYLLTQPAGARPTIVDDRNFYRPAGVKRWVRNKFLNPDIKLPLGAIWAMRTQIEADLLLQNLMLSADAMGLGAWIHGSISPPVLLGDPRFRKRYGPMLGFDWTVPKWRIGDVLRWHVPLPWHAGLRANAIGLRHEGEHLIKAACPPHYETMRDAVQAVAAQKFGPNGIYTDEALFDRIYKGDFGARYLEEASDYAADVIECTADICTYIYETHRRFPSHCEAIHVPGVWMQAHHVDEPYYERADRRTPRTRRPVARLAPHRRPGGTEADDARQSLQPCHQAVRLVPPPIVTRWREPSTGQVGAALQSGAAGSSSVAIGWPHVRAKPPLSGQRPVSGSARSDLRGPESVRASNLGRRRTPPMAVCRRQGENRKCVLEPRMPARKSVACHSRGRALSAGSANSARRAASWTPPGC
jgi:hypothetical protein